MSFISTQNQSSHGVALYLNDIGVLPMDYRLQEYFSIPLDKLVTKFTTSSIENGKVIERRLNLPLVRGGKNGRSHLMTVNLSVPSELVSVMKDYRSREFEYSYKTMSINHSDNRILEKKRKIDMGHIVLLLNYFQDYWMKRGDCKRIPLSTYLLEKNIGPMNEYSAYLKRWLQENDYIQISVRPVIDETVTCYRLTEKFINIEWVDMEFNLYMYSDEMVNRLNSNLNMELSNNKEVYESLVSDLSKIAIDESVADVMVSKLKDSSKLHAENIIRQYNKGRMRYTVDRNGRLYTPITSLKSEIRDSALVTKESYEAHKVDNKVKLDRFVSCDLNSSQMFMLGKEMMDSINSKTPVHVIKEYQEWYSKCLDGTIYDSVPSFKLLVGEKISKVQKKKLFFNCIFGDGYSWREVQDCFDYHWHNVNEFLYKRKLSDYKSISHDLQAREASIIYGEICKRMKEEYPDVPIFTVHDQIYFPQSSKETHEKIVADVCAKHQLLYMYNKKKSNRFIKHLHLK
jgi:hypothetical protein